jgi:hypothetical protein
MTRWGIVVVMLAVSCGGSEPEPPKQPSIAELLAPPTMSDADKPLAGAFEPLEGMWEGRLRTYRHSEGQQDGDRSLLSAAVLGKAPYTLAATDSVRRVAANDGPIFQRLETTKRGRAGTVRSSGGTKVLNGALWRASQGDGGVVIEWGESLGPGSFRWVQRNADGQQLSRYDEALKDKTLTIVGWYYGADDDPTKAPGHYVVGELNRVR